MADERPALGRSAGDTGESRDVAPRLSSEVTSGERHAELDAETVAAYCEGLLTPSERRNVETALAANPELFEWLANTISTLDAIPISSSSSHLFRPLLRSESERRRFGAVHEAEPDEPPPAGLIAPMDAQLFENALRQLGSDEQALVVLRLNSRFGFSELANILNFPSPDLARLAFEQALDKLAALLGDLPPREQR